MIKKSKIAAQERDQIAILLSSSLSLRKIAKKLGVTETVIKYYCKNYDLWKK